VVTAEDGEDLFGGGMLRLPGPADPIKNFVRCGFGVGHGADSGLGVGIVQETSGGVHPQPHSVWLGQRRRWQVPVFQPGRRVPPERRIGKSRADGWLGVRAKTDQQTSGHTPRAGAAAAHDPKQILRSMDGRAQCEPTGCLVLGGLRSQAESADQLLSVDLVGSTDGAS
jgi:hypothetical protein